jgi:hypothetical protein
MKNCLVKELGKWRLLKMITNYLIVFSGPPFYGMSAYEAEQCCKTFNERAKATNTLLDASVHTYGAKTVFNLNVINEPAVDKVLDLINASTRRPYYLYKTKKNMSFSETEKFLSDSDDSGLFFSNKKMVPS